MDPFLTKVKKSRSVSNVPSFIFDEDGICC